eukprot:448507-Pyramimonas_sp.AAC.1
MEKVGGDGGRREQEKQEWGGVREDFVRRRSWGRLQAHMPWRMCAPPVGDGAAAASPGAHKSVPR